MKIVVLYPFLTNKKFIFCTNDSTSRVSCPFSSQKSASLSKKDNKQYFDSWTPEENSLSHLTTCKIVTKQNKFEKKKRKTKILKFFFQIESKQTTTQPNF